MDFSGVKDRWNLETAYKEVTPSVTLKHNGKIPWIERSRLLLYATVVLVSEDPTGITANNGVQEPTMGPRIDRPDKRP